jgi:uncharacterized protein (TIGR02246 family)
MTTGLDQAAERAAIEELHRRDMAASKARDVDTLLSLCSEGCVLLPPGEAPIIGGKAIAESLERDQEREEDYEIIEYVHDFAEVRVLGNWAFEWGAFSAAAQPVGGGRALRSSGKILRILERQEDGTWKVARSIWNNDPVPDDEGR